MSVDFEKTRDIIVELCMRLPEGERLQVLANAWAQVARGELPADHVFAARYLLTRALPSARENTAVAWVVYGAALAESLEAARIAGGIDAEIEHHRQQLARLDELVQCGGLPAAPELARMLEAEVLDVDGIKRLLEDPNRGRH